jgi:hypothetical protein
VSGGGLLADSLKGGEGENGGEEGADWRLHGRCNYSDGATVVHLRECFKGRTCWRSQRDWTRRVGCLTRWRR